MSGEKNKELRKVSRVYKNLTYDVFEKHQKAVGKEEK